MRKTNFLFILIILSFLVIGAVSASDDNSTNTLENAQTSDDSFVNESNTNDDVLKSTENTVKLNSQDNNLSNTQQLNTGNIAPSKSSLKITKYSNFVKKGSTYYMYLTDSNGNPVANKKISIKFNGKTYKKTTNKNGKFGIKIKLSKSSTSVLVSFKGDKYYKALSKKVKIYIVKSISIKIGNSKLLDKGYLRIYLKGPKKSISHKSLKISVGKKVFRKKTTSEGFVIIKPNVEPDTYNINVKYGKYKVSKKINCINESVKDPLKEAIPTKKGVPDIDFMPGNYILGDNNAKYTLKKAQYREVIKRDSYCLYLHNKLTKYTFFKTKACPKINHIIKREKWNVIERALNTKLVKKNKYSYWPSKITVSLKGKSYTYSEVRDIQNTPVTCGPTSASVCSQVLKKFNSEKYFQIKGHAVRGINIPVLKKVLDENLFKTYYFNHKTLKSAVNELAKGGAALIAYLPNHYVAVIDVSPDGKKILVSNSYGSYNVGSKQVPTNWVSLKYFKTKFANTGLVVKLNYKLTNAQKEQTNNFYTSMGANWHRQNVHERIPNIGL